ncbi:hypothetical protein F5Y00DRAFT_143117 [Daldinia vernicosa]|uniref:uncharacterized protein n=1 Tax=Daldinia vernicosa TaxID=114800 RepID=UPI00200780BB|nr:uncharacterized protein F5Y00DRAFT_143117 [Daldinia vernicosa]KAI0846512.1 hypothetical protein F5Y00DRAFT_143117 [Daldinia vernicosa]
MRTKLSVPLSSARGLRCWPSVEKECIRYGMGVLAGFYLFFHLFFFSFDVLDCIVMSLISSSGSWILPLTEELPSVHVFGGLAIKVRKSTLANSVSIISILLVTCVSIICAYEA